ncbi:hypothetical protein RclHR1_15010006 [Rhizophagus clarus]|uniref:Arrestin-like N-terminal domain-containing protein n=1 Tax=Rhizophagus clarus TaxID=94130 RepID=A0A2Z6QG25_9GLOM|nr:hypothetical protein RclHR1_15010006 [Rhizophagus clarus]GET02759.1 hypothetical protein GLOIN_2v1639703 [Rhizophagus clarus]
MRPTVRLLKTKSSKCFFSYPYNMTSFQTGYLGIGPSKISGGFHLRYPSSKPIHISRIDATLVGLEAMTFYTHDDINNAKNIFYSSTQCIYQSTSNKFTPITFLDLNFDFTLEDDIPPSYSLPYQKETPLSQNIIRYEIRITITRKRNFFKLQKKNKFISMTCHINRYSLPSTFKLRDVPILMHRSGANKKKSNFKLDNVQFEALLFSEYIDMNSIMTIPLTLTLPDSNMKIKEIGVIVKEHQKFKNVEKEVVHFDKSDKILEYTLPGESIEIIDGEINKYFIEMKLDIPAFESANRFQAFEGVRPMKHFKVRHVLKIKIKFENEGKLVLKKNIWLQRSFSEKKILKGRTRGLIYN